MQKVKIQNELSDSDSNNFFFFKYIICQILFEVNISIAKNYIYTLFTIIIIIITIVENIYYKNIKDI